MGLRIAFLTKLASVEAYAPASMGNVGIGFDIFGMAFQEPGDTVRVEYSDASGVEIVAITGDGGRLPLAPDKNTASVAVAHYLRMIDSLQGVRLWVNKGLPLASGLGSSAASAVAGVFAVNALFGEPLERKALLAACLEGEAIVSGYHADNVGPSLLGGITLITGTAISDIRHLPVPSDLHCVLVTPHVAVETAAARAVLPQNLPLDHIVRQTGQVARFVDALYRDDLAAVVSAMEADLIAEPARAHLMPHLDEARRIAKRAGALGLVISGAGPTLCALCGGRAEADATRHALDALYQESGIGATSRVTCVDREGARIIRSL
ncbi:MAG: homoserine kinase [Anaerolineaceae bacterium]|nr:MAG: homoserine kinase [Anaerolineaceae bacterium]